jgi:hypothetical protein
MELFDASPRYKWFLSVEYECGVCLSFLVEVSYSAFVGVSYSALLSTESELHR